MPRCASAGGGLLGGWRWAAAEAARREAGPAAPDLAAPSSRAYAARSGRKPGPRSRTRRTPASGERPALFGPVGESAGRQGGLRTPRPLGPPGSTLPVRELAPVRRPHCDLRALGGGFGRAGRAWAGSSGSCGRSGRGTVPRSSPAAFSLERSGARAQPPMDGGKVYWRSRLAVIDDDSVDVGHLGAPFGRRSKGRPRARAQTCRE